MRYKIMGFNQAIACELGINLEELLFLRWFKDFNITGKMKYVFYKGKNYYWVNYYNVIRELPILGIRYKKNLRRFLKKMVDKGLLEYYCQDNKTYYRLGEKVNLLMYSPKNFRNKGGSLERREGFPKETPLYLYKYKDSIAKDSIAIGDILKKDFKNFLSEERI